MHPAPISPTHRGKEPSDACDYCLLRVDNTVEQGVGAEPHPILEAVKVLWREGLLGVGVEEGLAILRTHTREGYNTIQVLKYSIWQMYDVQAGNNLRRME